MNGLYPSMARASYLVSGFEHFESLPYLDDAGIPSIGFGTTIYPNGIHVTMVDKPCNRLVAEMWLGHALKEDAVYLWKVLSNPPNENQWAAMLSLTYNEGWPRIITSTLVKDFNSKDLLAAADQFLLWDKIHKDGILVPSKGLLNRREDERKLFLKPV